MFRKFSNAWQIFWFKEQSPEPLALFRILFGLFVFQLSLFELAPNFPLLFGIKAMFDTASVSVFCWQKTPIFDLFLILPQSDLFRFAFFGIFLLFSFLLIIGFLTRFSALIVYLGLLSFDNQCPLALDGGDDFMRIIAFLLIFSAAGEAFSLDRILKAKMQGIPLANMPPVMVSPWPQRMIQVQISLVYAFAFLSKIVGDQWLSGTAVYYALQLVDFSKYQMPKVVTQFPFYKILTYYTLIIEFSMSTLIWIKPARYWILLAAIVLHLGIDWAMNLPCFELLFISSYIIFVDPNDLKKLFAFLKALFGFKRKQNNLVEVKITQYYNHMFLPTMLLLLAILISGVLISNPIREHFIALEGKRNYDRKLAQDTNYWTERVKECSYLPEGDESRLTAEEALGVILSLKKDYIESGKLLRIVCEVVAKKNQAYNPELIRALSALAILYLETYHFDAADLCYKTVLDYDINHFDYAPDRQSVELNNLGVINYFRALLAKDKTEQTEKFIEADSFFEQALNKLHNSKIKASVGSRQLRANILLNRSLSLRDLGHLKAAQKATAAAENINSDFKKFQGH